VGDAVVRAIAAVSATEWLGVALALAYLILAVRQSAWCWLFAATSSGVYLWLFARAGLTMQAALQVFYIAMAVYGWLMWRRGPDESAAELPTRWPAGTRAGRRRDRSDGDQRFAIARARVIASWRARAHRRRSLRGQRARHLDGRAQGAENWLYWIALINAAALGSRSLPHGRAIRCTP
jgi:hypothetical protein